MFSGTGTRNLTIQWYARVNVTNYTGTLLANAVVNISDVNGLQKLYETTPSSGLTNWTVVTEGYFYPGSLTSFDQQVR